MTVLHPGSYRHRVITTHALLAPATMSSAQGQMHSIRLRVRRRALVRQF